MTGSYSVEELIPYISWEHFYHTWSVSRSGEASADIKQDALKLLASLSSDIKVNYLIKAYKVVVDTDDLVFEESGIRVPFLRQQIPNEDGVCLCLTDYVGETEGEISVFATSADKRMEQMFPDDEYKGLLAKTLADRLAEAAAEKLHEDSGLKGVRPAVGYPSIPDLSINFLVNDICNLESIGIRLTETGMMMPHASVSGFILSDPNSKYFAVRPISEEQLADYAHRRGFSQERMRQFIYDR